MQTPTNEVHCDMGCRYRDCTYTEFRSEFGLVLEIAVPEASSVDGAGGG